MDTLKYHSEQFLINGIIIPEFELNPACQVRIYIPNFDRTNRILGMDLAFDLTEHFKNKWQEMKWAKNYSQPKIPALIRPTTVERYLRQIMNLDSQSVDRISAKLQVNLKSRLERLNFKTRKALTILATFNNHNSILFDYYGIDALSIKFLENLVNSEIEKGKSAIAFDNIQYAPEMEPFGNILPIKISSDQIEESN